MPRSTLSPESERPAASKPSAAHRPRTSRASATSKWRFTRVRLFLFAVVVIVIATILVGVLLVKIPHPFASLREEAQGTTEHRETVPENAATTVKVVRPSLESSVPITVETMATVEPYYRADLRARASGSVKAVHGDIGDRVKAGDILVEIDVPESDQDVAQKKAMILQREQELRVSESKLKDAKAARDVSKATIKQRQAEVQAALATRDLKKRIFERYKALAQRGTVVGSLEEEQERDYLASEASVTASSANVDRAFADYAESDSKVEGAAADIELKRAQIEVARRDLDRAKVVADFGKVVAPFDGVIVRRWVDLGSFVPNATTGVSEPLISVSRVDLVTVIAKFTDDAAPFISKDTPCVVQIDDLPGVTIGCKVTRFSPSIQDTDRTVRVEVDLFNGDEAEYERVLKMFRAGGKDQPIKGAHDAVPVRAFSAASTESHRLLPGMTGTMKLSIGGFGKSFVLPSTCIYSRSGASYILVVENGKTKQLPVRIQLNDGKVARVSIVSKIQVADGTAREVLTELTGKEKVVAARQLEVGDGAVVSANSTD